MSVILQQDAAKAGAKDEAKDEDFHPSTSFEFSQSQPRSEVKPNSNGVVRSQARDLEIEERYRRHDEARAAPLVRPEKDLSDHEDRSFSELTFKNPTIKSAPRLEEPQPEVARPSKPREYSPLRREYSPTPLRREFSPVPSCRDLPRSRDNSASRHRARSPGVLAIDAYLGLHKETSDTEPERGGGYLGSLERASRIELSTKFRECFGNICRRSLPLHTQISFKSL